MNKMVLKVVESYNPKVVVFDIDGTLKDLCKEHSEALRLTLNTFGVKKLRRNIVMAINKVAMAMVKTGLFSTNHTKQHLLVNVFGVLAGINRRCFYDKYFEKYIQQICLFEGAYDLLSELSFNKEVYFATINRQNYNLEECGIYQERIMYTEGTFKVTTYEKLLKSLDVDKSQVLVVGDNVFDDLLSAKRLGVNCLLVNCYKSKIKALICKFTNGKYLK